MSSSTAPHESKPKDIAEECGVPDCNNTPESGQKFKVCSRCKAVAYCSATHQKEHWRIHKSRCSVNSARRALKKPNYDPFEKQITALWPWTFSTEMPPLKERIALLQDFAKIQIRNIQKSIKCDMLLRGGYDAFDWRKHYLRIELRYRKDCKGNPGFAFLVETAETRPLTDVTPGTNLWRAYESGRAGREADDARLRREDAQNFEGIHLVLTGMEGYSLWSTHPIYRTPDFDKLLMKCRPELWCRELQAIVERGFSFEFVDPDDLTRLGRIKRVGRKWKWVALSDEELKAMGFEKSTGFLF
ncbi:hypothetical protein B0H34DRAFT_402574 [Crassisporium funariophilum]|nr:hypothetical protein B0H34DRAFT_402574 [Crassisporium funariophilum]